MCVVLHIVVDDINWQVNQHAGDFRRLLIATYFLHERVNARADVLLVVGVLGQNCRQDGHCLLQIA